MEKSIKLLKEAGLSKTQVRVELVELFLSAKTPLNITDIKESIKIEGVNESTFYRNLQKLVDVKILQPIKTDSDFTSYELRPHGHHHHHIECSKCHKVKCLDVCTVEKAFSKQAKLAGFTLESHSLKLFGICDDCKNAKNA